MTRKHGRAGRTQLRGSSPRCGAIRAAATVIAFTIIALLTPLNTGTASAAPATASVGSEQVVGGAISLGQATTSTTSARPPRSPRSPSAGAVAAQALTALPMFGALRPVIEGVSAAAGAIATEPLARVPSCAATAIGAGRAVMGMGGSLVGPFSDFGKCLAEVAGVVIGEVQTKIIKEMSESAGQAAMWMIDTILQSFLTEDTWGITGIDLNASWFVEKNSVMRSLALYFLVPLFMLAMIQAVVRGSLYFVLRAALVMLPVAILGSVVVVFFTHQLLNVADSFTLAVTTNVTDLDKYGQQIQDGLGGLTSASGGLFLILWCLFLILAGIVILVELILRQTGIYLAALFMPLAFSALVWPSTAKWARRLVEVLIALIFSKLFIAGAIALGLSAMAGTGWWAPVGSIGVDAVGSGAATTAEASVFGSNPTPEESGIGMVATASAILVMAAFTGAKVLAIAPGSMAAAENRVAEVGQGLWGKGQITNLMAQKMMNKTQRDANSVAPSGAFKPHHSPSPGGAAGGIKPTPIPQLPAPTPVTGGALAAGGGGGGTSGGPRGAKAP